MTPTEATNRITEFVRRRESVRWWQEFGGVFIGITSESIAAVVADVIAEVVDERLEFLDITEEAAAAKKVDVHNENP